MSSSNILDLKSLLVPINDEQPSGPLLRYTNDKDYSTLKETYYRKYPLSMSITEDDIQTVPWPTVIEIGAKIIATKSKDLEPATWLVEALAVQHGLPGVRDGFRLLCELLEGYWEDLHPQGEDTASLLDSRANQLEGLNDVLPSSINASARQMEAAQSAADGDVYLDDIDQCLDTFQRLQQIIDEKFGPARPRLTDIEDVLRDYARRVENVRGPRLDQELGLERPGMAMTAKQPGLPISLPSAEQHEMSLVLHNRKEALQLLKTLTDYFHETEPLGPLVPLLQCALRWANMSFPQWLQEVLRDDRILVEDSLVRLLCAETSENSNGAA